MSKAQILALMPIIVLSCTTVVLMLQASIKRSPLVAWLITVSGMLAALWGVGYAQNMAQQVTPLLVVDGWGLFFTLLVLIAALVTLFLSREGFAKNSRNKEEYYLLLTLSVLGAVVLIQSSHVATLVLGMELMGVALYAMISFPEKGPLPLEAAIKYLVLSACASAMMLFGFALLYAAIGDLSYAGLGAKAAEVYEENPALIMAGTAMVISGIGFKLSVVPFHMWTPDVYQGAPTPVTGFLATVSKGAVFIALTRIFISGQLASYSGLTSALTVVAVASMLIGNLLALRQDDIKRLLAYSSIAHFGYLLVVLIASSAVGAMTTEAVTFYLAAYMATILAAFTVVTGVAADIEDNHREGGYRIAEFTGLFWHRPLQATVLTVSLLSLAGIPLTAGFVGKFYIINIGVQASLWLLLAALVVGSAIAIYYYLKVIFILSKGTDENSLPDKPVAVHDMLAFLLLALVLVLGIWPQPFIALISEFP